MPTPKVQRTLDFSQALDPGLQVPKRLEETKQIEGTISAVQLAARNVYIDMSNSEEEAGDDDEDLEEEIEDCVAVDEG